MKKVLGTLAALLGATAPAVAPASVPPAAIVHEIRPKQVVTSPRRQVPKTPPAVARKQRAHDKRAAKRAYRNARRAGKPIKWREAHRRAGFWSYLMAGGTRAHWNAVHAQIAAVV